MTEADETKTEADETKTEADETKTEADETKTEADETKTEAEETKTEAESVVAESEKMDEGDGDNPTDDVSVDGEPKKTIISLGELVDLALCTPEPGAVNFNLLRSVLHALVNRLDLVDIKAEILDEDTDNVFSQIAANAEKLGLKDFKPRSQRHGSAKDHGGSGRHHHHRRSRRSSHRSSSRQGRPDSADPASGAERGESGGRGQSAGGSGGGEAGGGGVGSAEASDADRSKSGTAGGRESDHSEEFDQLKGEMCPPDSAGQPDVAAKTRSQSAERADSQGEDGGEGQQGGQSGGRRSTSAINVHADGTTSATSGGGREGSHRASHGGSPSKQLGSARVSSSDSLGFSSSSDSDTGRGAAGKRSTLSELAEHRLKQSGRHSAVSISSGVEGSAVLSDYTSLDRLEKKFAILEEKLDIMELAEMLPKVRELQAAVNSSQEDVAGLWQNLQLMKKVDANEEGIDKLTGIIENSMGKLKKMKKHTDKLDKELVNLLGGKSGSGGSKGDKPLSLSAVGRKYDEIRHLIDGLMGVATDGDGSDGDEGGSASKEDMREVGAQIITWNTLETALKDDLSEMGDLNEAAMMSVSEQKMGSEGEEGSKPSSGKTSKVKRLLANLSKLVEKHKALENRVGQMESALGDNFSDRVLEQLQLLKASATQIQQMRNKLTAGVADIAEPGGWSDLDVVAEGSTEVMSPASAGGRFGSLGSRSGGAGSGGGRLGSGLSGPDTVQLASVREPSEMDLNHLSDWLNYNKARMEQLEKALVSQSEQVRDFSDRLGDQVVSFRDKLERVERELAGMLGRISSAANKGSMSREDSAALHEAYGKIQTLQMDVEALTSTSKKIVSDRGEIDDELSMLIRALEELKECKVDRATLDELIETKADRSSVEKKISTWQFEQACQELSEGLGAMLEKLGSQETDWVRSMDEIHVDLHKKLDRVELAPLRRYINARLKNIMMKLNRLIAEDESPDATMTRRKILRDLNCLSCDDPKKISGYTKSPNVPMLDPFPASLGDRHVTSFRMGSIRRHQQMKCEPYKDLTSHEGAFRSHIKREIDYMTYRGIPHHPTCPLYNNRVPHGRCTCVATRFCGGSHTKINCVDTRRRRIGLGAPLMSFGAPLPGVASPARASKERLSKTPSESSQQPRPATPRRSSTRPGSGAAQTPTGSATRRGSANLRQVQSSGSALRKKPSVTPMSTTKSAPGVMEGQPETDTKTGPMEVEVTPEPTEGEVKAEPTENGDRAEPTEGEVKAEPAEDEVKAEPEAPATQGEAPAPEAEAPASDETLAPAGEEAPAGEPGETPAVEASVDGEAAAAGTEAPAETTEAPAAEAGETPAEAPTKVAEGETAPAEEGTTPAEGDAPAPAVEGAEGGAPAAEDAPEAAAPPEGAPAGDANPAEGETQPAEEPPAGDTAESAEPAKDDSADAAAEPAADGDSPATPPPAAEESSNVPAEEKQEEAAAEGAGVPVEGAEAPAEGAEAPAEGAEAPAEGAEAPAEGAEAPAEAAEAPAEGAEAPAEGAKAPAEGAETPVEGAETPVEGAEAPAEGAKGPAEGAEAPAEGVEAPAEGAEAPAADAGDS